MELCNVCSPSVGVFSSSLQIKAEKHAALSASCRCFSYLCLRLAGRWWLAVCDAASAGLYLFSVHVLCVFHFIVVVL